MEDNNSENEEIPIARHSQPENARSRENEMDVDDATHEETVQGLHQQQQQQQQSQLDPNQLILILQQQMQQQEMYCQQLAQQQQ